MRKRLFALVGLSILLARPQGRNSAAPAPAEQYVFVQDLDRVVGVHRGMWHIYGQLNSDGELIAEGKHRIGTRDKAADWKNRILNELSYDQPRPCYELHSGRLIKGVMTAAGSFVPDIGSQVTKFEDYHFTTDAIPIWNLPGFFMRRDKLEERRKVLAEFLAKNPEYASREYGKEKAKLDAAFDRLK